MVSRWVAANDEAGRTGDWSKMSTYLYVRTLIDDHKGEFIGIWRQIAPVTAPDGNPYEIAGTGGSWFRYTGGQQWSWRRDFSDHANAGAVFGEVAKSGQLTKEMLGRMKQGSKMPSWTRAAEFDWFAALSDPAA